MPVNGLWQDVPDEPGYGGHTPVSIQPGCLFACYNAPRCMVGWPDGSCGGLPRGECLPPVIPPHLPLKIVLAFERHPDSWPVYNDWCLDHGWPERAALLAKNAPFRGPRLSILTVPPGGDC